MRQLTIRSVMGLAAASFLVVGSVSNAQSYFTNSIDLTLPANAVGWSNSFALPKFDVTSATLISAVIQATEGLNVSGSVSNAGTTAANFVLQAGSLLTVNLPNGLGSLQPQAWAPQLAQNSLAAGAAVAYGPYVVPGSDGKSLYAPNLGAFIGSGTLQLPAYTQDNGTYTNLTGNGTVEINLTSTAEAGLEVSYIYTIPEPVSGVLLLTGAGLMLMVRRWRRS